MVKRFERGARDRLKRSQTGARIDWMVLGFAYYFQGDIEEMRRAFEASLKLSPGEPGVLGNASAVLSSAGELRRASEIVRDLVKTAHGTASSYRTAITVMGKALLLEEAAAYLDQYRLKHGNDGHGYPCYALLAEQCSAVGLSADLRLRLLETAVGAIRREGLVITQSAVRFFPHDFSARYELVADADVDRCAAASVAIAEALVEKFDEPYAELLTFACRSASNFVCSGEILEVSV